MAQTSFQYHFLALFPTLAGSGWSGRLHRRAGERRGRVDLLRWLGGRAGGHPVPRPRPAERPSGRGKHMQSTWPDLDLNSDSHYRVCLYTDTSVYTHSTCSTVTNRHTVTQTLAHRHIHTFTHTRQLICVAAEHLQGYTMYLWVRMWHTKWSLYIICIIKNTSVECIQPETPTQTHTCLPHSTCRSMVMLTLSPSDSACRWVFYILLKEILPLLLWRVLHLVKSHYYGNVRVLEIMARWEQLDCLWHNNPTLSISSASSLSHSLYCILPPSSTSLYLAVSLRLTSLAEHKAVVFFSPPQDTCLQQNYFVISIKHYMRAFTVDTFLTVFERLPSICYQYCWKLYGIRLQSVASKAWVLPVTWGASRVCSQGEAGLDIGGRKCRIRSEKSLATYFSGHWHWKITRRWWWWQIERRTGRNGVRKSKREWGRGEQEEKRGEIESNVMPCTSNFP